MRSQSAEEPLSAVLNPQVTAHMQTIADLRASLAALERHAADGAAALNAKDAELAAMRASLADRAADAERAVLSSDEWYGLRTVDRTVRSHYGGSPQAETAVRGTGGRVLTQRKMQHEL